LQHLFDGATYDATETVTTPGFDLIVDFVSVTNFDYVQIVATYNGAQAAHSYSIQLYDWTGATWVTWDSMNNSEPTNTNHGFYVPCPSNYIGTGGNDGDVRVRFNHTVQGLASHDITIDVVCLYDREKYFQDQIDTINTSISQLQITNTGVVNVYDETSGSARISRKAGEETSTISTGSSGGGVYPSTSGGDAGVYPGACSPGKR
jgi:hypothetical protein